MKGSKQEFNEITESKKQRKNVHRPIRKYNFIPDQFIDSTLQKNMNYYLAELQEVLGKYFEMDEDEASITPILMPVPFDRARNQVNIKTLTLCIKWQFEYLQIQLMQ